MCIEALYVCIWEYVNYSTIDLRGCVCICAEALICVFMCMCVCVCDCVCAEALIMCECMNDSIHSDAPSTT